MDLAKWASMLTGACLAPKVAKDADVVLVSDFAVAAEENARRLCHAALRGDIVRVQKMLSSGVDANVMNYDKRSPLHLAAGAGHLIVVEALLESGADAQAKDRWGQTPLDEASRSCFPDVRTALLRAGARGPDESPENDDEMESYAAMIAETSASMRRAASAGAMHLVQEFLEAGADLNATDFDGRTALHVAAARGHKEVVGWLADAGADVRARDVRGVTAWSEAATNGHRDVADLLAAVAAGWRPQVSVAQDDGETVPVQRPLATWAMESLRGEFSMATAGGKRSLETPTSDRGSQDLACEVSALANAQRLGPSAMTLATGFEHLERPPCSRLADRLADMAKSAESSPASYALGCALAALLADVGRPCVAAQCQMLRAFPRSAAPRSLQELVIEAIAILSRRGGHDASDAELASA